MSRVISDCKMQVVVALVPAAGIGSRMKTNSPKQYLQLVGKTIIEHSISALLKHSRISQIISLQRNDTNFHKLAIAKNPKIKTVIGGYRGLIRFS